MKEIEYWAEIPILASIILALTNLDDVLLYAWLPVQGKAIGIPVVWVGILLSINRFVRLVINHQVAVAASLYSLRLLTIAGVRYR